MLEASNLLVTGANGFLGSAVANAFSVSGWNVVRCARRVFGKNGQWRHYDLTEPLPLDLLSGVDVVIHTAFVPRSVNADSYAMNLEGSRTLIEAAHEAGARVVFISSLSARRNARSQYGRQKFAIEECLDFARDLVVRPGLILGQGGVFGRLLHHVQAGRPTPIVDGGQQPLQTINLDDLVSALQYLVSDGATGRCILAETPAVSYRTFFRTLARTLRVPERLIPIPACLLLTVARIARASRIRSPVDEDNVLGLLDMQFVDPATNGAIRLPRIRDYEESLRELARAR